MAGKRRCSVVAVELSYHESHCRCWPRKPDIRRERGER